MIRGLVTRGAGQAKPSLASCETLPQSFPLSMQATGLFVRCHKETGCRSKGTPAKNATVAGQSTSRCKRVGNSSRRINSIIATDKPPSAVILTRPPRCGVQHTFQLGRKTVGAMVQATLL